VPTEDLRCFACDRKLWTPKNSANRPPTAYTLDGKKVFVGLECFRHVEYWDIFGGYQPPEGGPKLFLQPPFPKQKVE